MKSSHGGPRDGAGRKPIPATLMKSVKLTPAQWERARLIGDGNSAEGIRRALDAWQANK
ncbi:MAG TPA: hypothetical protein P5552_14865 [Candidatus Competibacteraceae bacterium]|nr:hypothetical protein [Candidatus Competibacteraceae bacterium]